MKYLLIILFLFSTSVQLLSQGVDFKWVRNYGNTKGDAGNSIALDASGNVYATGFFQGTIDVDPSPAIYNLTAVDSSDIYIIKLNALGNLVWARQIGNTGEDAGYSVVLDNTGNVYCSGKFQNTVDFDPGPGTTNLSGSSVGPTGFICKFTTNGGLVWASKFDASIVEELCIDVGGNLLATGRFHGVTDFDPGAGNYILTVTPSSNTAYYTQQDIFVLKLGSVGSFVWAKQVGGNGQDYGVSITTDAVGNVYTIGYCYSIGVDFDPGSGVYILPSGGFTHYILKLDAAGNFVWAKPSGPEVAKVRLGGAGEIYICGFVYGTMDFDPGPSVYTINPDMPTTLGKAYVTKLDAAGNFVWAKNFGGLYISWATGMTIDAVGNIYTTGSFTTGGSGLINDFDPNAGTYALPAVGSVGCVFISKLTSAGNLVWAKSITSTDGSNSGYSICVDATNNVYTTGLFYGVADFDPNQGVFNISAVPGTTVFDKKDAYIHKMSQCLNANSASITITACDSYILNGQTYTTSGTYNQLLTNALGCDSTLTLHLTISGSTKNDTATACESYYWQGHTLSTSGHYTDTLTNVSGCDSVLNLLLTIKSKRYITIDTAICQGTSYAGYTTSGTYVNTFTATNGCDSVRTLSLTIKPRSYNAQNATICEGQSFWGHTTSGTYTDTLVAANGCDSIRTLYLLVNSRKLVNVNVSICQGQQYFAGGANQATSGVYRDTLQSTTNCDSIIITLLTVHPKPVPNLGSDRNLCEGSTTTLIPGSFTSYLWQNASTSATLQATTVGIYWVKVTDANDCSAIDTVVIKSVFPIPANFLKPVDSICQYESIKLRSSGNYSSYLWSTGSTQPMITVDKQAQYELIVKDFNGCTGRDTINILPKKCLQGIYIPTAFTPNGDGKNDIFKPVIGANIISFQLQIFDRWGRQVFQTTDGAKGWNGKNISGAEISDTYVWIITFKEVGVNTLQVFKGTVTLLK